MKTFTPTKAQILANNINEMESPLDGLDAFLSECSNRTLAGLYCVMARRLSPQDGRTVDGDLGHTYWEVAGYSQRAVVKNFVAIAKRIEDAHLLQNGSQQDISDLIKRNIKDALGD